MGVRCIFLILTGARFPAQYTKTGGKQIMQRFALHIKTLSAVLAVVLLLPLSGCAKKSIYPHDGVVYSSRFYADGAVYFRWLYNEFAGAWPLACA